MKKNDIIITGNLQNASFYHFSSSVRSDLVWRPRADRHLAPLHGDWEHMVLVPHSGTSGSSLGNRSYSGGQARKRMEMVCKTDYIFVIKLASDRVG